MNATTTTTATTVKPEVPDTLEKRAKILVQAMRTLKKMTGDDLDFDEIILYTAVEWLAAGFFSVYRTERGWTAVFDNADITSPYASHFDLDVQGQIIETDATKSIYECPFVQEIIDITLITAVCLSKFDPYLFFEG
jgi:hypothetical protein